MLSIQQKFSTSFKPAFKSYEVNDPTDEDFSMTLADMDQETYDRVREDLRGQKSDFLDLANNKEFKLPKALKKTLEGGAVVTTGLLGGMATGWGTKQSIKAFSKLAKSTPIKNFYNSIKDARTFLKNAYIAVKQQFLESNVYKKPAEAIKKQYNKFAKTTIGKPVTKYYEAFTDGLKTMYRDAKNSIKSLWKRIKGVKKETYEKAVVNTVGTSGGIASGVTAIKETQEKNNKTNKIHNNNDYYEDNAYDDTDAGEE